MPENRYLANCSRNESTLTIMPTTTLLCSHRRLRRRLADVVTDRQARVLDLVPDRVHRPAAEVVDIALSSFAGIQGNRNVLSPNAFSSASVLRVPFDPPVDEPDAVEVTVGTLLQIGDVLVVDAEHPLANRLVG